MVDAKLRSALTQKDNDCGSGTLAGAGPGTLQNVLAGQAAPQANPPGVQIGFNSPHPNGSLQWDGRRASFSINWTLTGVQQSGHIVQHVVTTSSFENSDGSLSPAGRNSVLNKWEAWPVTVTNGQVSYPEGRNDTFRFEFIDRPAEGGRSRVSSHEGTAMFIPGQNAAIGQWGRSDGSGGLRTTTTQPAWWNPAAGDTARHSMTHKLAHKPSDCSITTTSNP